MSLWQSFIDITSQFGGTAFLLELWIGWDLLVWLFVAVPWPAPLTIMLFWKCFGFVPMAQRTRAHFCMARLPERDERSVTLGLVLISWPLSLGLRWLLRAGHKRTGLWGVIGTVERAKAAAQINRWKTRSTGLES